MRACNAAVNPLHTRLPCPTHTHPTHAHTRLPIPRSPTSAATCHTSKLRFAMVIFPCPAACLCVPLLTVSVSLLLQRRGCCRHHATGYAL